MAGRHRAAVVGVGSAMEHRPTLQRAMRHEAIRESVEAQRQLSESIQRAETRQLKVAPTIHAIYEWSDASAASHFGAHEVAFYMWLEHAIEALPTVEVLGAPAVFVDLSHVGGAEQGLLGMIRRFDDRSLFVKMMGPSDAVVARRDQFLAFCRSLSQEL